MQGSEYWLALEQRWPRLRTGSILAFSGKTGDARSRPTCGRERLGYETILYAEETGPVGTITLNRPDDGNMFTPVMCHEVRDCIDDVRRETRTRVIVLTGAGERGLCIGKTPATKPPWKRSRPVCAFSAQNR